MIKSTSQLSRSYSTVIDGFNKHLNRVCVLQKVVIEPYYRFFTMPAYEDKELRVHLNLVSDKDIVKDEIFFKSIEEANRYWSSMIDFKGALF